MWARKLNRSPILNKVWENILKTYISTRYDFFPIVILMYVIYLRLSSWCMWFTYDCHLGVCDLLTIVILMYVIYLRLSSWCMWFTYDCHFDVCDLLTIVILVYVIYLRLSSWCMCLQYMTNEKHIILCLMLCHKRNCSWF